MKKVILGPSSLWKREEKEKHPLLSFFQSLNRPFISSPPSSKLILIFEFHVYFNFDYPFPTFTFHTFLFVNTLYYSLLINTNFPVPYWCFYFLLAVISKFDILFPSLNFNSTFGCFILFLSFSKRHPDYINKSKSYIMKPKLIQSFLNYNVVAIAQNNISQHIT